MTLQLKLLFLSIICLSILNAANGIVNGHNAQRGQFPYAAVLSQRNTYSYFCGAAILSNWHMISVGHCVLKYKHYPHELMASVDAWDINAPVRIIGISTIHVHPKHDNSHFRYDIAILKTSSEIIFNQYVKPIPLPTRELTEERDFQATLAGWGALWEPKHENDLSPQAKMLQYQTSIVLNISKCLQYFESIVSVEDELWSEVKSNLGANMLCTINPKGSGSCVGDSGNGLVDANGTLIGISSASVDCADGFPDFYTNVFAFIDWIDDAIRMLPGRTPLKMTF